MSWTNLLCIQEHQGKLRIDNETIFSLEILAVPVPPKKKILCLAVVRCGHFLFLEDVTVENLMFRLRSVE